jgi:23S rRNA (uracil1939-C5)-methyltransferase
VIAEPVEESLQQALPADLVILNPPRAGLHARVPEMLTANGPEAVVYVSCNPATLARDLGRLGGYEVRSVVAFDMFPQTAHVETVAELVRAT